MRPEISLWMARSGRALLVASLVLAVEVVCVVLLARGWAVFAVCLHLAVCTAAAALASQRGAVPTAATAIVQMTAMMLPFLGPVAATCAVIVLLATARSRGAANAARWHEHLFPNLAADELSERAEAIARHRTDAEVQAEIESFFDVLRWGTLAQQEHVLSLVSRSFKPEFAPVLRAGLAVDDIALRAQAAAGLSLLEARTSSHLNDLAAQHRASVDAASGTLLAKALASAAHSGLYDPARASEMRLELVSVLTPFVQSGQSTPEMTVMLGRALVNLEQYERAVETLQAESRDETALSWLLEAMFRQGDFARLSALVAARADEVRRLLRGDGPLSPALRFWAEGT